MPGSGGPARYRLVTRFAGFLLALFYRRIEVVGIEHIPAGGPLILTANHQNALVDPMLLLATVPRRLVPIAKAPLFRHPLIGPFLHLLGAVRVHRRQEAGDDPARNSAMFSAAIQFLADRDLRRHLLARRRALVDELAALARLVPDSVRLGQPKEE